MPNHVSHVVTVTGPVEEVARFRATMIREQSSTNHRGETETWTSFDFNALVPMPAILADSTSGIDEAMGYEAIMGHPIADALRSSVLDYAWVRKLGIDTSEALRSYLEVNRPDVLAAGERAVEAERQTGFPSWYPWAIARWGTKWNAYAYEPITEEPDRFSFRFDTAWSTPDPIWTAIAQTFPLLHIEVVGFDEGWNFAVQGVIAAGMNLIEHVEATDDRYAQVYGMYPESYDEEDHDAGEEIDPPAC